MNDGVSHPNQPRCEANQHKSMPAGIQINLANLANLHVLRGKSAQINANQEIGGHKSVLQIKKYRADSVVAKDSNTIYLSDRE